MRHHLLLVVESEDPQVVKARILEYPCWPHPLVRQLSDPLAAWRF